MTDNEKRAHDLALCVVQQQLSDSVMRSLSIAAAAEGNTMVNVSLDEVYMNAYETALGFFKKRFPDGGDN